MSVSLAQASRAATMPYEILRTMQMSAISCRRRDRHGIHALRKQLIESSESATTDKLGGARTVLRQRVDDADKRERPLI